MDAIFLLICVLFFAATIGLLRLCTSLRGENELALSGATAVAGLLLAYLVVALLWREILMTGHAAIQVVLYFVVLVASCDHWGHTWHGSTPELHHLVSNACWDRSSGSCIGWRGQAERRNELEDLRGGRAAVQPAWRAGRVRLQRLQGTSATESAAARRCLPPTCRSTPPSASRTNTNWQSYSGESTLSYLTQMLGLTVQNFVSAATGMAVLVALIRGLQRKTGTTIGNFWVDLVRGDALHPAAAVAGAGRCAGFAGRRADALRRTRPSRWCSRDRCR